MPDSEVDQNPEFDTEQMAIEQKEMAQLGRIEERGRTDGPPSTPDIADVSKHWEPPKNQSTPNNRSKKP